MAAAELADIAACIRTLGLAPTKARNLKAMSQASRDVGACTMVLPATWRAGRQARRGACAQAWLPRSCPAATRLHRPQAVETGLRTAACTGTLVPSF